MKLDKICECGYNYYKCDKCGKEIHRAGCFIDEDLTLNYVKYNDLCIDCHHQVYLEKKIDRMWDDIRCLERKDTYQQDINKDFEKAINYLSIAIVIILIWNLAICTILFLS